MPALQLFGRKWLAATDDMVFPGLFEFLLRLLWLSLLACATSKYYPLTYECTSGGDFIRVYLAGMLTILAVVMCTLIVLINRSAQGAITDTSARRYVPHIVAFKVFLLMPEVALNIMGTIWAFSSLIDCDVEKFTCHVIEGLVVFDWGLFALSIFGLAFVFDPIGSTSYYDQFNNTDINIESIKHRKTTRLWMKRFRWFFCWVRKDAHCHEAFQHVAALLSAIFRSTDLVPSDIIAGCVLLRVKQKRKTREVRRLQLKSEKQPRASSDIREVFATAPHWMCMKKAKCYLNLSIAAYGWPFVLYRYCLTGIFRLLPEMMCCFCFRTKSTFVTDDNCCLCNLAGVKYTSNLAEEDILFASFRNRVFELPFCVIAHHKTSSIVIAVRGSISLRDIFTDLTAAAEKFEVEGLPPDSMAHKGMIAGAKYLKKRLDEKSVLERAFAMYPHYDLILTGHSLGAGVAVLLAFMLRPTYPELKVYAFATPGEYEKSSKTKLDFCILCSVTFCGDLRTAEDTLPKEDHLRVVRNMIKHIHYFVNNVHNDGSAMDELRKTINSLCRRPLYIFLRRHIYHWPLDSSFLLILETYLSFIQPWRYIKYNSRASGESNFVDNKWFNFIVENFPAYTILIREIIPRFSRMDLTSPKHAHMLFRLSKVLSQPNLANILKDIEKHLDDSSAADQDTNQMGTPKTPSSPGIPSTPGSPSSLSFPWFNRLNVIVRQEIQELESANFQYKALFSKEFHQQVFDFVLSIQQALSLIKYLLNSAVAQRKKREENIFHRIKDFFFYSPSGDDYTVDERQKTVTYLEHSITFLSQVFDLPPLQVPMESKNDVSSSSVNSSCSQQFGAVEPTVINPKDWQKRTKLIRYESNPDLEPVRSTEITFLVRFLHHLSTSINEKYKTELQQLWERTDFWGNVVRHLLAPPCKFYYFDKSVPGNFAPRVPNQLPPRVCLRTLASHQTLFYIFFSGVLAYFYGYPVIPFYFFMFFLFVCLIFAKALLDRYFTNRRRVFQSAQPEPDRFVPLDVSFTD